MSFVNGPVDDYEGDSAGQPTEIEVGHQAFATFLKDNLDAIKLSSGGELTRNELVRFVKKNWTDDLREKYIEDIYASQQPEDFVGSPNGGTEGSDAAPRAFDPMTVLPVINSDEIDAKKIATDGSEVLSALFDYTKKHPANENLFNTINVDINARENLGIMLERMEMSAKTLMNSRLAYNKIHKYDPNVQQLDIKYLQKLIRLCYDARTTFFGRPKPAKIKLKELLDLCGLAGIRINILENSGQRDDANLRLTEASGDAALRELFVGTIRKGRPTPHGQNALDFEKKFTFDWFSQFIMKDRKNITSYKVLEEARKYLALAKEEEVKVRNREIQLVKTFGGQKIAWTIKINGLPETDQSGEPYFPKRLVADQFVKTFTPDHAIWTGSKTHFGAFALELQILRRIYGCSEYSPGKIGMTHIRNILEIVVDYYVIQIDPHDQSSFHDQ